MFGQLENIKIQGISSAVPAHIVDNMDFASEFGEKYVKKQIKMTGIKKRHVSQEKTASEELCYLSANDLLQKLGWKRDSVDVLIYVTEAPNFLVPSTAFYLQKRLGLGPDCMVFDMNLGCPGWAIGMQVLASLLHTFHNYGRLGRGLLLTGSIVSCMNPSTPDTALLFGDAGAATALEYVEGSCFPCMVKSNGNLFDKVFKKSLGDDLFMDGAGIFDFSINQVTGDIEEFMKTYHITGEADYYVFHQAQKFILDNLGMILDLPQEKVLTSYEEYGNTTSAAIPLTICKHKEELQKKEKVKLLCYAFGAGLSWGGIYFELDTDNIHNIQYV